LAYIVPFDDNINFHKVSNIHHVRPATNILSTQLKVTIYHIIYKII
jgi:formyltetrahydrofolate synthetase